MRSAEAEGESWPRFSSGDAPHIIASMEGEGVASRLGASICGWRG